MKFLGLAMVIIGLLATACGGASAPPTAQPTPTATPEVLSVTLPSSLDPNVGQFNGFGSPRGGFTPNPDQFRQFLESQGVDVPQGATIQEMQALAAAAGVGQSGFGGGRFTPQNIDEDALKTALQNAGVKFPDTATLQDLVQLAFENNVQLPGGSGFGGQFGRGGLDETAIRDALTQAGVAIPDGLTVQELIQLAIQNGVTLPRGGFFGGTSTLQATTTP